MAVQYQLIMGFSGPISINQTAIHNAMKLYKIKNQRQCFEKIMLLNNWWIERLKQNES